MKNSLTFLFALTFLFVFITNAHAQPAPFPTFDFINVNNINARQMVHGDMWWDPGTQLASCEFPKGSGKNIGFAASLWMSGYDAGNQLHIAAQTYRQNGNDYWPGPLDTSGTITYTTSQDWARIWKVNISDISTFLATSSHTTSNTPQVILEWPAKGNPYAKGNNSASLTITQDMAPFIDVNNDGMYNPLQGDYPAIKGDQALWWVFSDNGPNHTESNGTPLKVEIHAMAFAYSRGTSIDNVVYYEYNIFNRASTQYTNFRIGQWADIDLGWWNDDYIGFDSSHRMGIVYNGSSPDGSGQVNSYGNNIPVVGVTMIILPGDNAPTSFVPAGSFMYNINDASVMGNPATPGQHNNYLRSLWRDSTHLVNNFQGYGIASTGYGTGTNTNYVFTGDPSDTSKWSECSSKNTPGDRRLIITSNDFTINSGASQKVVMALVTTNPELNNACPITSFDSIKIVADTAWANYFNPPHQLLSVNNVASLANTLHIYPNPAHDKIYIETNNTNANDESIAIYNSLGQTVNIAPNKPSGKTEIAISGLPTGVYYIQYRNGSTNQSATFIKD